MSYKAFNFLLLFFTLTVHAQSKVLLYSDFENDSEAPNAPILNWRQFGKNDSSIAVTSEKARKGKKSVKFDFKYDDWYENATTNNNRAEICACATPVRPEGMSLGKNWWVGFSEYIPADWEDDYPLHENEELIWQYHGGAWPGLIGPASLSPALSANISGGNLQIIVRTGLSEKEFSVNGHAKILATIPVPKGKWTDWVIMSNFDYTHGAIKIWADGKVIVDYQGSTLFHILNQNSEIGTYFKIGSYKWFWGKYPTKVNRRILFADEIRIGDSTCSYEDVKP